MNKYFLPSAIFSYFGKNKNEKNCLFPKYDNLGIIPVEFETMNIRSFYIFFILIISFFGCKQVRKATDIVTQPTAREVYERDFEKNDSDLIKWKSAFESSKLDSVQITLPYSESGVFSEGFNVYSYGFQLKEGQKIIISVEKEVDSAAVFIDVFERKTDSLKTLKLLKSAEKESSMLTTEIEVSGYYQITVQPQMKVASPFILKIYTQPIYGFPVSGGDNKSIQSFWADPRDAGSRSHEGVDIFGKRGTPVVAVTKGVVSSTGDRGLGGKQVWLRDGFFGKTMYYAHLDSIAVESGKRVESGDTLGFVGNTGNARTTAPHLHFGIYRNTGAVNPLPYIKLTEIQEVSQPSLVTQGLITRNRAEIKKGPSNALESFGKLSKNDTVLILGKSEKWYHVKAKDSTKGFVQESFLKDLLSN